MGVRRRSLGHRSINLVWGIPVLLLILSQCSPTYNSKTLKLRENENNPYAEAVSSLQWSRVLSLSEDNSDPFVQLVHLRALYELKKYSQVISSPPIQDSRFRSYDYFLKTISHFESEKWEQLSNIQIPDDLPSPLKQRMLAMQGQAAQQLMDIPRAQKLYEQFLKDYPRSSQRVDILSRLADLSFSSGDEERAIQIYEELYKSFPFSHADAAARTRLMEAGRFDHIDMDSHLERVSALRKSALFTRAHRELDHLIKKALPTTKPKLLLAKAQIYFADKNYSASEKLARATLKKELPQDLEIEWKQLQAASLVRLDRAEEGMALYRSLLTKKLSKSVREIVLYRLGMTALSEKRFEEASQSFFEIRNLKFEGAYNESSRWFGAWSALMSSRQKIEADPTIAVTETSLTKSAELLNEIEKLNTSPLMQAQSLYWGAKVQTALHDEEESKQFINRLTAEYPLSIYGLLHAKSSFNQFTNNSAWNLQDTRQRIRPDGEGDLSVISDQVSWQRLELFRAVRFNSWAQMELDSFLENYKRPSSSVRLAIADRLYDLGDWASVVVWADRNLKTSQQKQDLSDPLLVYHYPRAYEEEVLKAAKEFKISPFLIWGIMREESRYQPDAVSGAGAVGLMQVMPFRAAKIARSLGIKSYKLSDPKQNIRFGAYHLRDIRNQMEGFPISDDLKPVLQIASYNAGVEAAKRWTQELKIDEVDTFMESIPYAETRSYVKRVLQSAYIYSRLYGANETSQLMGVSPHLSWRSSRNL